MATEDDTSKPRGPLRALALSVLSAVLFQLAFPPVDVGPLVFVCLVPWLLSIRGSSAKGAFWSGYLMGFIVVFAQMSWLHLLVTRWTHSEALSLLPWVLCGFLGAFYFAFAGLLIRSAFLRRWYWIVPLLWAGIEVGRSYVPGLAFPWFILATPLWPYPGIDQLAFFGTIYIVSGWVCLVNVALFLLIAERKTGRWLRNGVSALGLLGLSIAWYCRPIHGNSRRFLVGQPGYDLAFGSTYQREAELSRRVHKLYDMARSCGAGLLVLPEGVGEEGYYPPLAPFAFEAEPPVLFGGQRGFGRAYQTAFLFDHGKWSYADKNRLVVFGEYVPGRDFLPFLRDFKLPSGDLQASSRSTALHFDKLTVGPLLCFEGLFYDVAHHQAENGSQVLAIMSIDDWYMGTAAPEQLKDAATWRAIETGLPVLRSASTGYTLAVDQKGRLLGSVPVGELQGLPVSVVIEKEPTRNPLRPLFPWMSGICPFGFLVYCWWQRRKNR